MKIEKISSASSTSSYNSISLEGQEFEFSNREERDKFWEKKNQIKIVAKLSYKIIRYK